MIYDCFTFFNELDLLEIRFNILKDVVDKFVLVEAKETYSGLPKKLWFDESKWRFKDLDGRIIHLIVDKFPETDNAWVRESWQRNYICEGLKACSDTDVILLSDVDEIPNPDKIRGIVPGNKIWMFEQKMYYYYVNYQELSDPIWDKGTKMMSYKTFCHGLDGIEVPYSTFLPEENNRGTTATKLRLYYCGNNIPNGGWHFSFLGGTDAIIRKLKSFSHQEFNNNEVVNAERIARVVKSGEDLLGRKKKIYVAQTLSYPEFPRFLVEHQDQYKSLIAPVSALRFLQVVKLLRIGVQRKLAYVMKVAGNFSRVKRRRIVG